jgi:uncharacterized integral membrane protein (TIGR00697 family)
MNTGRSFKYYDLIMAAYVSVLLCANLIGAIKTSTLELPLVGTVTFATGVLFFPISYFFGDILTEVYGYARDRRCVWAGFTALAFASFMAFVVTHMPPSAEFAPSQSHMDFVFGSTWRIAGGSIIAFWCGSLVNSFVLAKMKIATGGRWLWTRTIGSTLCGEAIDSALFYSIAFGGTWDNALLVKVTVTQYVLKSSWEILSTPLTYWLVNRLKRVEHEDFYDRHTNFTPFSLKT